MDQPTHLPKNARKFGPCVCIQSGLSLYSYSFTGLYANDTWLVFRPPISGGKKSAKKDKENFLYGSKANFDQPGTA